MTPRALNRITGRVSPDAVKAARTRLEAAMPAVTRARLTRAEDIQLARIERLKARLETARARVERLERTPDRTPKEQARLKRARAEVDRIETNIRTEREQAEGRTTPARADIERTTARADIPERTRIPARVETPARPGRPSRVTPLEETPKPPEQRQAAKLPDKPTDKQKRLYIEAMGGGVAQNMGKLKVGGKLLDVWHTWLPNGKHLVVKGAPPRGAKITADGPGSARKTTQAIGGDLLRPITYRHGAVTTKITPARTRTGAKADFSPFSSIKRGKIFHTKVGKHTLLSRHRLDKRHGR